MFFCEHTGHLKKQCYKYKKWPEAKKEKEQKGKGPEQKGSYQQKRERVSKPKGGIKSLETEKNGQKEESFLEGKQVLIDAQVATSAC